jgi:broad-specificity NMP kinase
LAEGEEVREEPRRIIRSELIKHYEAVAQRLKQRGYSEEKIKKVLAEEIERLS